MDKIQHGEHDSRRRPQPEEGPLAILYEDQAVIVLDKPPGVVVHPTYKHPSGTLLNALLWRYRDRPDLQPGILTRLDKDTSGVVVVALTPVLHAAMQREMHAGHIRKEYLALVCGTPEPAHGRIALPLGRSSADRRVVVVREDGARCITDYEVIDRTDTAGEPAAMVRCTLLTGRTHQIRVHFAASGWPIVGDAVYGQRSALIDRQALHAWRVTFPHPQTRAPLQVTSSLPKDIASIYSERSNC